jgi:hypothetical protein
MTTTVKDTVLEPFYCSRDNHGWTVFEMVQPQEQYTTEDSTGDAYKKAISHPSNFGSCLRAIAELKTNSKGDYNSIESYINTFTKEHKSISEKFKVGI